MKQSDSKVWLVSGAAGFIGSHLVEELLNRGDFVVGIDNFATGSRENVRLLEEQSERSNKGQFHFRELSITDEGAVKQVFEEFCPTHVLHQAALGSVPRSIEAPVRSHKANVDGFINMLEASRLSGVHRFVYASSSSVYGDSEQSPKREEAIGNCLSPYAATKRINEVYAQVYGRTYGLQTVGLRYFNVFGPRQDPNGPYAAVIPRWLAMLKEKKGVVIYGDGSTSRDFCYVKNVVHANLRAALVDSYSSVINEIVNIACARTTSLLELERMLRSSIAETLGVTAEDLPPPMFEPFRKGDIRHSLADIGRAQSALGYVPSFSVAEGIRELVVYNGNISK